MPKEKIRNTAIFAMIVGLLALILKKDDIAAGCTITTLIFGIGWFLLVLLGEDG